MTRKGSGSRIPPPVIVQERAPGRFGADPLCVAVAEADVAAALVAGQEARLLVAVRLAGVVEGPRLRIHPAARRKAGGPAGVADDDELRREGDACQRGGLIEAEVRVCLVPRPLDGAGQVRLVVVVAVVGGEPAPRPGRRPRRGRRALEDALVFG